MFKLIHISDIHLGPLPPVRLVELLSKRLTGYINWHRNRAKTYDPQILPLLKESIDNHNPDHIAITGDLINIATDSEILNATKWLHNFGLSEKMSFIPGNHDAYVLGAFAKTMKAWKPYISSDRAYIQEQQKYHFPYLRIRGEVAIIGLSTANAMPPLLAGGVFSKAQASRAKILIKKARDMNKFIVVLIHHPPIKGAAHTHKAMIGIRNFENMISECGVHLVLHGHTHLNTTTTLTTKNCTVPVVGIASASQNLGAKKPASSYNLFLIEKRKNNWQCTRQHFQLNSDEQYRLTKEDELLPANL